MLRYDGSPKKESVGFLNQELYHGVKLVLCEELKNTSIGSIQVRSKEKLTGLSLVEYRT
ncbi:hypothetical protein [Carnobacterium viridans]|uniref:hypothetical protein n=1 Tax=Carnobacterium viridans TaxID=174587 RepID=UPI000A462DCE|nr:hypothetical protein [Carnobacterium viridans]